MVRKETTFKMKNETRRVAAVNRAFNRLSEALKDFKTLCLIMEIPIRSVTYRVLDNGDTRCRATYRKPNKCVAKPGSCFDQDCKKYGCQID